MKIWVDVGLAKKYGLKAAVIYAALCAKHKNYARRGKLTEDGAFYCTIADLQECTSLTREEQNSAIQILAQAGLISYSVRGQRPKRYFKINDTLARENVEKPQIEMCEIHNLNCGKSAKPHYINIYNNNYHKSSSVGEEDDVVTETINEVLSSTQNTIRVNGVDVPTERVQARFRLLSQENIDDVLRKIQQKRDISNLRAYLITALYNAPLATAIAKTTDNAVASSFDVDDVMRRVMKSYRR